MRDIAFVAFLFAFIGVGFRKPFLFVLCFCYHFDLFIYGWKIDPNLILFGNAYL